MTAFELMEVTMMLREEAQRHFEYWLNISFAFMAATFIGRKMLTRKVALCFAAMYTLTVSLLITRYTVSGRASDHYLELAIRQGAEPVGTSEVVVWLRVGVFMIGTLMALWFLYMNTREREAHAPDQEDK